MASKDLLSSLQAIRRKTKVLGVAFGGGVVLAVLVGLVLGLVGVDYLLDLSAVPRLVLSVGALGVFGYVLVGWVIRPGMARLPLSDVAGRLEHVFPQFDDRLRSTVDFLRGGVPGSQVMQDRVVAETTQLAQSLDLRRAIAVRPVGLSLGIGAGAVVLAMLLSFLVGGQYRAIALTRLAFPFGETAWPKRVQIALVKALPQRIPVGDRLDIKMRLARGDRAWMKAVLYYQYDDGPVQQEYMDRDEGGGYSSSLDAKGGHSLKAWMKSGDDEKILPAVSIVPRLAITGVEAAITPPAYAHLPAASASLSSGPAITVAGAKVALHVGFNKALAGDKPIVLELVAAEAKAPGVAWSDGGNARTGTWTAQQSLRFRLRATDADGFTNTAVEEYELVVRPDQNPTVQIEVPRRNEERTTAASVPLQGVADDDYGVQSLKLVVDRIGSSGTTRPADAPGNHWEIPLVENAAAAPAIAWTKLDSAADRQRFRVNYAWELSQLAAANLKPGEILEYYLLVQDNFALDGATHAPVASGKLRIVLVSQDELVARVNEELRNIAYRVTDIRNTQTRTGDETQDLAKESAGKKELDAADRAAAQRLANQQSMAASQTRQVAAKPQELLSRLNENRSPNEDLRGILNDTQKQLAETAENPMKNAGAQIAGAAQPKQPPEQRTQSFAQAAANQQAAADQLQKALDRIGNVAGLQQTIDRIREILKEQQRVSQETAEVGRRNLGKRPEQMSGEDRERLEKAVRDQEALAQRSEKAMQEMPRAAEQMAKSDPAGSDALKQAAQAGQQQQVAASQSAAAQQARQNQQSAAQASQKQAELGLEMILSQLRAAERHKLEELAKRLEEMQKQIASLVRRQAGHNLDDLNLQGAQVVGKADPKVLDTLLERSQRKGQEPVKGELSQLTSGQEQTERNTRSIAAGLEDLPNGTEPAGRLVKAAGRMERAAVLLREQKLAEAYEPPQVEALGALEEALRQIDEQKAKVDEERKQQDKETIRETYVKIRQDQEKVNNQTATIDAAPRTVDGTLRREDAIRLGQLPTQQGQLAERVQKLEESLAFYGSVVYVWANKDIATTMNQVKDDLARAVTSRATQTEQARILAQLDAMIENLAVKTPEPKKFAQREGGGGSAGGGQGKPPPKLPPEVELRLLKDLQVAVNNSTKALDAEREKNGPKLSALGNRQSELRTVLDALLRSVSGGQMQLPAEPENRDQLPEEASLEQIEAQELDQQLLNQEPTAEGVGKDVNLVGDRMARSRQRLALNQDPGKTTQVIQDRILKNLDELIQMARQQQSRGQASSSQSPTKPRPQPGQEKPANQQANSQPPKPRAQNPAQTSTVRPGGNGAADLSDDIRESMKEWGGLTQRQRQAVIEGSSETVIEKYKKLVDDYYRSLATKATEQQ